ncbi:hypothetical protein BGX34_000626 [Mortierella sp. NVP85]|nr:hypothetical protein BGX34_000626 [Mortierella sp. NVP85]
MRHHPDIKQHSIRSRVRLPRATRATYDFEGAKGALEGIEDFLDTASDCTELVPALDQLMGLSGQHPGAWEPHFKTIVDLLVGWHIDRGTSEPVRKRIGDVLSSFSTQWREIASFGQDLLECFVKDIETAAAESTPSDSSSLTDKIRLLLWALVTHALPSLDRIAFIQQRTMDILIDVRKLSNTLDSAGKLPFINVQVLIVMALHMYAELIISFVGNEILLILCRADSTKFYEQQQKAIQYLSSQLENPRADKATWDQVMSMTKKILALWKPRIHPKVTLEAVRPMGALMQLRWRLPWTSSRAQQVLDIIISCVPERAKDVPPLPDEYVEVPLSSWTSVMQELENLIPSIGQCNRLSKVADLAAVIETATTSHQDELERTRLADTKLQGALQQECRRTGYSAVSMISNMTFDVLLLVGMAKLWPDQAAMIFIRLLEVLATVPESRLTVIVHALREISTSQGHFISNWFDEDPSQCTGACASDASGLDRALASSIAGIAIGVIKAFVTHWKLLSTSVKLHVISWNSEILTEIRPNRYVTDLQLWNTLRRAISSTFHQLITIAGSDEDEVIRGSIATIFENFIGTFGSFSLGPEFLATMTDRSFDISAVVRGAWRRAVLQANPFVLAFECYRLEETDITRALKVLVLRSPNSGIFRYPHFSIVLSALASNGEGLESSSNGNQKDGGLEHGGDMLQRLFHACQGQDILVKLNAEFGTDTIDEEQVEIFQHSLNLLTYWSLWETARYCVLSRLRTPFGGPQQTLDVLEKHLNGLLHASRRDETNLSSLSRLRDFLLFLDRLELQFYNAQQGTALGMIPLAPKPSIVFVRSNRKMLDEWFSRIRSRVIEGAKATGQDEIVIRNGYMTRYEQSAKEATIHIRPFVEGDNANDVSAPAEFLCQSITNNLSDLYSYEQLQAFMDTIPIDTYANETMLWSEDPLTRGLKQFCAKEDNEAWERLKEFFDSRGKELSIPDTFAFDRSGLIGRNYLFASRVHQNAGLELTELDHIRQRAEQMIEPSVEFLMFNGLEHAGTTLIDSLMLNTATTATPKAVKEFMDHLALIPEEMRLNMLHQDLRYWARLDVLVNLALKDTPNEECQVRKQSNEFKFLLSRIARRSDCHEFASIIPETLVSQTLEIQFEEAKAAMVENNYSGALFASARILDKIRTLTLTDDEKESANLFQSKIYLKMAKWSRLTKPALNLNHIQSLEKILGIQHEGEQLSQSRIESITSASLKEAVKVGRHFRKSWFEYGTHYYKQGWGILDELGTCRLHHPVATSANESLVELLSNAGVKTPEVDAVNIFKVFVKYCASGQPFDEVVAYDSIRAHVAKIDQLNEAEDVVTAIIDLFKDLLNSILDAYRQAIEGYFEFLQFDALEFECHQPQSKTTTGEEVEVGPSQSSSSESNEITATLRLLRLLAKHGGQLYDCFDDRLAGINVTPWANIIPQLFARLDHPELRVQSLIAGLLCKIGAQYPQLIVFHATVGVKSEHNSPCQRRLLGQVGDFLDKSRPDLVLQVKDLIRELERITVLWEEVWYKRIMTGLSELKTTLQELTEQYHGLDTMSGLGAEDKHAVMSDNYHQSVIPLLVPFETLLEQNSRPESKHERWFISTYRNRILAALDRLRSPKAWNNLFEGFNLLRDIYVDLGKELSGTRVLQLSNLSPELASIQSSLIDIPSPDQGARARATIQSFDHKVVVIPTKTKPKKLALTGSDGKRYTYLFKGLEDLHLDERIMQLLRITNGMLQRDKESSSRHLSARHYTVVPLSDSSGMIQWVENTVSMFTIIAKWQNRELMCTRWMNDDNPSGPHPAHQRATEIYHEKAAVALKKAGLPPNHPRRQWPKSMLLDLYHEMASETPAYLLEREIWSSSPTPAEWWRKSVRLARSTAVMSMIGYVIGLGDRHLDNILIDFASGDLVHIDYNVCFEKGATLRIPEIVPFRLSRNMLTSLGVTGVEGNFRIGCEHTMKVMRKNKEILVTLLEAFVYDPLVDWQIEATTAQGGGAGAGAGGQGQTREGPPGQVAESEGGSSVSGTGHSTRSFNSKSRRLSTDSLTSVSSISMKSTATVDSFSKRLNGPADRGDSTTTLSSANLTNGTSANHQGQQQQQQPAQQDQHAPHQRNSIAVKILRKVRYKLEGREFDHNVKCKVKEQVDRVILEATNVENLANMYEGWTPWL